MNPSSSASVSPALCALRALLCAVGCLAGYAAVSATQTLPPSADTFINSFNPDNNNGASNSIFTGTDGRGGRMRGLIRFDMPAALTGRATVTGVEFKMTTQALGNGPGTAATESLHLVPVPWVQGNGVGNAPTTFVVGQPCAVAGAIAGATWNQPNCPSSGGWPAFPGPTASAAVPAASGVEITWNAPAMNADVQGWIDTPATNNGWQIASSTEGSIGQAQRFFSTESGTFAPSLTLAYDCKPGYFSAGTNCTTCTAAANVSCAVAQSGNACIDSGPPSTTYTCACNNPIFYPGPGGSDPSCIRATLDVDANGKADALTDGLLIVRYMFGLTGTALIQGAIGPMAARMTSDEIAQYLAKISAALNVDGNPQVDAFTDGVLVIRYLFGLRGAALVAGAVGQGATRSDAQIESHIQSMLP